MTTLAPGKRISLEELVDISKSKPNQVVLEDSLLSKIDAEVALPKHDKEFDISCVGFPGSSRVFDVIVSRAALVCRLHSLLNLKSPVRSSTVKILADLINYEITPNFGSFAKAGEELIGFLGGKGFANVGGRDGVPASEALTAIGIGNHVVTEGEANLFIKHPFLNLGSTALVALGTANLMKGIDAIVALSVEATGVRADGFDPVLFEQFRQHRGQMLSACNLKLILEGSKRIGSGVLQGENAALFQSFPQIVGPAHETLAIVTKSLETELNSSELVALDPNAGFVVDDSQIASCSQKLLLLLNTLATSSYQRTLVLQGKDISTETFAEGSALSALKRFSIAISAELHASLTKLQQIENEESKGRITVEKEEKQAVQKSLKPDSDDSNMTPEQLAKAEAKRKAKAEKAAAKAAAKEQRRSGIVLGSGSSQLRSIALACVGYDIGSKDSIPDFGSKFAPLSFDEEGLCSQFAKVIEQLNVGGKRKPKIAKGTRDFTPDQMRIREQAFNSIRKVFKRHGGVEIDTPVFELKEILTGKYGEDSKLIYDLADQGGELLSLRYDLTVPFARFLAMNSVGNIKRYHIAKVYRRDNPQLAKGRYREFYQCDFDIAGNFSPMVPDAEVITVATEILSDLPVGQFLVKLNHRKILDAIFEICGVPAEKFRPICSAVDKLDKMSWEEVKSEMVNEKGLNPDVADRISAFVLKSGQPQLMWNDLMSSKMFGDHRGANDAMNELQTLFGYLDAMGSLPYVSFDLSLARGLDYYTGVIYEVVLTDGTSQVGSIAAGGRYDNLVGMFSPAGVQTPCVGVSIGIERVFTIMEKKAEQLKLLQQSLIQVFVASIGANLMHERMKIAKILWNADISTEYSHLDNPKFKRQLDETLERGIPFMVVFGQDEIDRGTVKVKNMTTHQELEIPRESLVGNLLSQGVLTTSNSPNLKPSSNS